MPDSKANIAVFIDAENVDPSFASQIFSYARSLGEVTVREIYGAGIALNEWADPILENTVHTNFTLRPSRYKNSSDIALVIGAMELLRLRDKGASAVDAVIIASSDSDFSPLAMHLRGAGIDVIGMGEPGRINPMWPKACTEFVELDPITPTVRQRLPEAAAPLLPPPVKPEEQAKPVEEPPSPPAPEAEKEPEEEKPVPPQPVKPSIKIAHSHTARLEIIRAFIFDQLDSHGGRIRSSELFSALSALPDYKFDQQRSKRKPLDYLVRQFGSILAFDKDEEGHIWIYAAPEPAQTPAPEEPSEVEKQLIGAGIPVRHAGRVAAILDQSRKLRDIYNALRQAFGNGDGKAYYFTVKELIAHSDRQAAPESVQEETKAEENPPQPSAEEEFLVRSGVPADHAAQAMRIVQASPNLRVAYNELRKAFGTGTGRNYLNLIKQCAVPLAGFSEN